METRAAELIMTMLAQQGLIYPLIFGTLVVLFGCYVRWRGLDSRITRGMIEDLMADRRDLRERASDTFRLEQDYLALLTFAEKLVHVLDALSVPNANTLKEELEGFYRFREHGT